MSLSPRSATVAARTRGPAVWDRLKVEAEFNKRSGRVRSRGSRHDAVPATALGLIERIVGALQQRLRAIALRR